MYRLLSSVQPQVRTCTRSLIFTPVADVLQKYLCTRISPVFIFVDCVHILIDVERNQKQCQSATLKSLHNEFPAVQLIAKEAQRF